jgi:hypothetical protein
MTIKWKQYYKMERKHMETTEIQMFQNLTDDTKGLKYFTHSQFGIKCRMHKK